MVADGNLYKTAMFCYVMCMRM